MSRPPRKISSAILRSLDRRPKLRYTLTSKGSKSFESGETPYPELLDSLTDAIEANNKQPVSLQTWRKFHSPGKISNAPLRQLVEDGVLRLVSRGKFTFAAE